MIDDCENFAQKGSRKMKGGIFERFSFGKIDSVEGEGSVRFGWSFRYTSVYFSVFCTLFHVLLTIFACFLDLWPRIVIISFWMLFFSSSKYSTDVTISALWCVSANESVEHWSMVSFLMKSMLIVPEPHSSLDPQNIRTKNTWELASRMILSADWLCRSKDKERNKFASRDALWGFGPFSTFVSSTECGLVCFFS